MHLTSIAFAPFAILVDLELDTWKIFIIPCNLLDLLNI
jgi:hypothetical protein